MSTLIYRTRDTMVSDVWFDSNMVYVRLLDGREIGTPLDRKRHRDSLGVY